MLGGLMVSRIRHDAARIAAQGGHVRIDGGKLRVLAASLKDRPIPAWDGELHFFDRGPKSVMYTLFLDAVNFCFWPGTFEIEYLGKRYGREDGYCALSVALKRAFEEGTPFWDPAFLAGLDAASFGRALRLEGNIPLIEERSANARDLGRTLIAKYGGDAANLLGKAGGDAAALADLLAANFACYADRRSWRGAPFSPMKRAQICASDLAGSFGSEGPGALTGADRLTCFADYKLPQLFHADGVFSYSPELERKILAQEILPENSEEEVEIRAGTIVAVERLKEALASAGRGISVREIDWLLWNESIVPGRLDVPHHRTITTSY